MLTRRYCRRLRDPKHLSHRHVTLLNLPRLVPVNINALLVASAGVAFLPTVTSDSESVLLS